MHNARRDRHTMRVSPNLHKELRRLQQYGYGGSPMNTGMTNPEMVRRQIAQDMGNSQAYTQAYGTSQQFVGQPYATGAFAQFGTQPQMVRQQIAQDLGQAQVAMGAYAPAQGYQPIQNQQYYNPAAFQQVMNSVHTDPQWIRQQIQQDIQAGAQPPAYLSGSQSQPYPVHMGTSTLSQFGTHPQMVQSHIRNDFNPQVQSFGPTGYGYGAPGGTLSQFGTHPQMVRQQIQGDLGHAYNGYLY